MAKHDELLLPQQSAVEQTQRKRPFGVDPKWMVKVVYRDCGN